MAGWAENWSACLVARILGVSLRRDRAPAIPRSGWSTARPPCRGDGLAVGWTGTASMVHADLADAPAAVEEAGGRPPRRAMPGKVGGWGSWSGRFGRTRTIVARWHLTRPLPARERPPTAGSMSEDSAKPWMRWTGGSRSRTRALCAPPSRNTPACCDRRIRDLSVSPNPAATPSLPLVLTTKVTVHLHAAVPADDTASDPVPGPGSAPPTPPWSPPPGCTTPWTTAALDRPALRCDPARRPLIAGDITYRVPTLHPPPGPLQPPPGEPPPLTDRRPLATDIPRRDPLFHCVPRQNLPLPWLLHSGTTFLTSTTSPPASTARPPRITSSRSVVPPTPPLTQANPHCNVRLLP